MYILEYCSLQGWCCENLKFHIWHTAKIHWAEMGSVNFQFVIQVPWPGSCTEDVMCVAGLPLWFCWCQWWMRSSHLYCAAQFCTASSVSCSRMRLGSPSWCRPYCHLVQTVWSILIVAFVGSRAGQ